MRATCATRCPHATLIAFTGTPITEAERDTRKVFGDDIDIYDLHRTVSDGATVPVRFEPRLIKLARTPGVDDEQIDDAAEELTAGLDEADADRIARTVAVLDTVYGTPERLRFLADDLVKHWETRRDVMEAFIGGPGKAMVVCATRSIAARLYEELIARRPEWHDPDDDDKGVIQVVYTTTPGDSEQIKKHTRRPSEIAAVKKRIKNADDELQIVIVKDMMLTGFDLPALHTLYVDRPLKGALLMQTLARVNRTYRGKLDGLLVAYAPLADNLTKALREFTRDTAEGERIVGQDMAEAEAILYRLLDEITEIVGDGWRETRGSVDIRELWPVSSLLRSPSTPGNTDPDDPECDRLRTGSAIAPQNSRVHGR